MELSDIIKEKAKGMHHQLIEWRRHLHANPELSFEEHNTMAFISSTLDKLGINHLSGVAGTGVVATIKGFKS